MDWTNGDSIQHQIIYSKIVEVKGVEDEEEGVEDEEEYLVGEEIIPTTDVSALANSLDHIAAENLIYMAHDGQVQSMGDLIEEQVEQVENADYNEQHQYFECQVTEECVVTDDWVQQSGEERVEVPVDLVNTNADISIEEEMEVPLPTDQDEYTTLRPYPCDFCSRRFRKKASLMNHMVAHQNDRPHVCNLCGARYIRRCDLHNHLKIHAYTPEGGTSDIEEPHQFKQQIIATFSKGKRAKEFTSTANKRGKPTKTQKASGGKKKPKIEPEDLDPAIYSYVNEPDLHGGYSLPAKVERYTVTDPRKPFVCQHCGISFAREKALQSHQKIHVGDSPFECETCNEMFWDPGELKDHQRLRHQDQGAESEYEPENEIAEDSESEEQNFSEYYCKICGLSFHRYELLVRHSKMHIKRETGASSSVEGGGASAEEPSGHCCNVCGESFVEALDLLAHAEVHARFQPLKCLMCGESFIEEQSIKDHIQQAHIDDLTEFTCRCCGKLCRDSRTLMKHSWDHSKEKNHSCSKCGKNFLNKARLKRHMVSHRNKSVTCDVCGDEFPDGRTLMNHRHSHSNVTGRQFPCRECGKTFGSRSSQQIHVRIHTGERPYGCRYCWKAFADGGTLRKHERIHTGEKPYVCSVCPRAFNQRVVLREHIRSHHSSPDTKRGNQDTPYYCPVCEELFATSMELIHHLIQHSDMNTAKKRTPVVGPRKYKRRRKLKPHELERLKSNKSKNTDDGSDYSNEDDSMSYQNDNDALSDEYSQYTTEKQIKTPQYLPAPLIKPLSPPEFTERKPVINNNIQKSSGNSKRNSATIDFDSLLGNISTSMEPVVDLSSVMPAPKSTNKSGSKKGKNQVSRPKMIHTQKTRVAVEDGKRKTKTLITRTTASSEPVTKSRSRSKPDTYQLAQEKLQATTTYPITASFSSGYDDPLNEILAIKQEKTSSSIRYDYETGLAGLTFDIPRTSLTKYNSDIVNDLEEILRSPIKGPTTTSMPDHYSDELGQSNVSTDEENQQQQHHKSGRPRRNVKQRYSFQNSPKRDKLSPPKKNSSARTNKRANNQVDYSGHNLVQIKQEKGIMAKANEVFKCEMCSAAFSDRAQLLVHVPIHI